MNSISNIIIKEISSDSLIDYINSITNETFELVHINETGTSEYNDDNDFLVDTIVTIVYSMELYCIVLPSTINLEHLLKYIWELKNINFERCPFKCASFSGEALCIEGCPVAFTEQIGNTGNNIIIFPKYLNHPSFVKIPQGLTCKEVEEKILAF